MTDPLDTTRPAAGHALARRVRRSKHWSRGRVGRFDMNPQFRQQGQPRLDLRPVDDEARAVGQQEPAAARIPAQASPCPAEPEDHGVRELAADVDPQVDAATSQPEAPPERGENPAQPPGAREAVHPADVNAIHLGHRLEQLPTRRAGEHFDRGPRVSPPQGGKHHRREDRVAQVVELDQEYRARLVGPPCRTFSKRGSRRTEVNRRTSTAVNNSRHRSARSDSGPTDVVAIGVRMASQARQITFR